MQLANRFPARTEESLRAKRADEREIEEFGARSVHGGENSFYSTSRLIQVIARKGNVVTTSVLKDFHNKTLSYFDLSNARDIEDASEERALQV